MIRVLILALNKVYMYLKKHCSVYRFYDQLEAVVAEEGVVVGEVDVGVMGGVVDEVSLASM